MKVKIEYSENLHFLAQARHFKDIHIDEPEAFKGTDLGPSSVEYLLIGLGGCIGSSFSYSLQKHKVKIENLEIVVDGRLKHKGPAFNLKLVGINIEIEIVPKEKNQESTIKECFNLFQEYCVILYPLLNGIPIQLDYSVKNQEK
ncbi:MAG: hypothetical protein BAJALOKI2v1_790014 [Promethearchaeota archaeon]|nr:MAG: hypothetical protein BAJALOKI2v1_790014 [Candidatus Lokiarchaeota archaeon]